MLENFVVMSPDAGGTQRAEAFKKKLIDVFEKHGEETKIGFVLGHKTRRKESEIEEYEIKQKNVLIVDDIIDYGNTLLKALKKLKEKGARKVYAYATHGLFTEGIEKLEKFDKIFVSDSVYVEPHEKIEVISVANLVGEAIFRIIKGESLSQLFEVSK